MPITGKDAFEWVVRRLEETHGLLAKVRGDRDMLETQFRTAIEENRRLYEAIAQQTRRADDLQGKLIDHRKGERPIRDLYGEIDCTLKVLEIWAGGKRMRPNVLREHIADVRHRMIDAAPFIVHEIPS